MKTIFTNGCFDILHRGHLELLEFCHNLGDHVIVGINSDASVTRLKGPSRPINNQDDRKYALLSLKWVNDVVIFDEDTPYNLIKKTKPDILVKGGDYKADSVIGSDICKVIIFDMVRDYSTTNIVNNMAKKI